MKEIPRLMKPEMVQAILAGRKMMTRRMDGLEEVNVEPGMWRYTGISGDMHEFVRRDSHVESESVPVSCQPGDRVWVKETHWRFGRWRKDGQTGTGRDRWRFEPVECTDAVRFTEQTKLPREQLGYHKRPSIFMPRKAARILLEVTEPERCERVQAITPADAAAEGLAKITKDGGQTWKFGIPDLDGLPGTDDCGWPWCEWEQDPCFAFATLWGKVHGPVAWARNDWVRVITFRRIEP